MGLDMSFILAKPENIERNPDSNPEIDFKDHTEIESYEEYSKVHELAYFRKHNRLHGWMNSLYSSKGGKYELNGQNLEITLNDLRHLKADLKYNKLHDASGFFWGQQRFDSDVKKQYNLLCRKIRRAIKDGWVVYYSCSW